jgi:MmpS family membrane protein
MSQPGNPEQWGQPHYNPYGQQPNQYGQRPPGPPVPPTTAHVPPPPRPAPKKRKKWPFIVGGIVVLFVIIGVTGQGGGDTSTTAAPVGNPQPAGGGEVPAPAAPAAPAAADDGTDEITYEVTGEGVSKANNITYVKDKNFGQQQENGAKLPWKKTIKMENGLFDAQPTSLVAQSGSGGSGSITCRILKNGQEVTSSTSSGAYAVVTCSGGIG